MFGGWTKAQKTHFADGGVFDQIYRQLMRRCAAGTCELRDAWSAQHPAGVRLTLGCTLIWLCRLIVLIPLAALFVKTVELSLDQFWAHRSPSRRVLARAEAFVRPRLCRGGDQCWCSGLMVAWVLVRYRFPGRRLVDAMVDLPFALPTAVAGIALTALYAPNGWLGAPLAARASRWRSRRSASSSR